MSKAEETFYRMVQAEGLAEPELEYRFALEVVGSGSGLRARLKEAGLKDWRFDFAWPRYKFAVEIEGGGWIGGRHNTGKGFEGDLRKYDAAMRAGWTVYRCSPAMVMDGSAMTTVKRLMYAKAESSEN